MCGESLTALSKAFDDAHLGPSERDQYALRLKAMLQEAKDREAEIKAGHVLIYPESVPSRTHHK